MECAEDKVRTQYKTKSVQSKVAALRSSDRDLASRLC